MAQVKVIGKSILDSVTWTKFRLRSKDYSITGPWMEPMSPTPVVFVDLAEGTTFVDTADAVSFVDIQDSVVIR